MTNSEVCIRESWRVLSKSEGEVKLLFIKADSSLRRMLAVVQQGAVPDKNNNLLVFDLEKKATRTVPLSRTVWAKGGGGEWIHPQLEPFKDEMKLD